MKGNFGLLFKNFSTTLLLFVYVLISLVLWQKCHTQSFDISCQYLPIAETRILSAWTSSGPFSAISISSKAYSSFNCLFLSKWVLYLLTRDSTGNVFLWLWLTEENIRKYPDFLSERSTGFEQFWSWYGPKSGKRISFGSTENGSWDLFLATVNHSCDRK